jgi:hypothetical protein
MTALKYETPIAKRLENKSVELEETMSWHKVMADGAINLMDSAKQANDMTSYKKYEHEFLCYISTYYRLGEIIKRFKLVIF